MTSRTQAGAAPTATEVAELKDRVDKLTELLAIRLLDPGAECVVALTDEQLVGDRAAFKYRYLSSLMTGGDSQKLSFVVARYNVGDSMGLEVNPGGTVPTDGNYLAGAGTGADGRRIEFSLPLNEGSVTSNQLQEKKIDVTKAFEQFVLRKEAKGTMVAAAPELPAAAIVTVIKDGGGGLILQRCGVQGGTHLAGVGKSETDGTSKSETDGTSKSFDLPLAADKISATQLTDNDIAITKPFERFSLRQGAGGPLIAVAPALS